MSVRRDFLSQPAPENYVAGLGRGATGFTTRSDLGPARDNEEAIKAAVAKRQAQLGLIKDGKNDLDLDDEDDGRYGDPDNEVGLFAGGIYEKDDEEADRIWKEVDDRMARRRQKWREAREKAEREEYERKFPKIQQQFAGLKRALEAVTEEEWANLPDPKDLTGRTKRARQARMQRFYAVPDSVLAAARDQGQFGTTVVEDGTATEVNKDGTVTDFAKIGAARDKVLRARLEQQSQSSGIATAGSATSIDPKGYLTSLANASVGEQSIGDIEQFRKMLKSAVDSNPKQAASWIAAARLEIAAGKPGAARALIAKGCQHCPKSEDIWLENIHINDNRNAKVIAAQAIQANPHSVKLWVEAMKLENDVRSKKKVIRRALDHNPTSEALWKEAVNLEEDPADARMLLAKATELIPESLDLWLALARLETPDNARKVLNKAVKKLPSSHELWIAAARLEEQLGEGTKRPVMKNAVKFLAKQNAMPKREEWIAEAEKCEEEGAVVTCASIIEETLGWGLDEDDDRKEIWMEDAKGCISRERFHTARAIYAYALRVFPNSRSLYLAAVELEREHGTKEDLERALEKAVEACPHVEAFWLMLAKEKSGEINEARKVLARAFKQNPDNEDIWLAAVKLEADNGHVDQARELLRTARQNAPTDRVWMRSVAFERQQGNPQAALELVQDALRLFPNAPKLWMMKGQIYEDLGKIELARDAYSGGVRAVPSSVPLWLLYSRLEERAGNVVKARSVLDRARTAVPKNPELWTELIRVERRAGNLSQARALMAQALQQMPRSGLLWAERILYLEPRTQRKALITEAIKKVEDDPILQVTAARILWAERKLDRAQNWFERALLLDRDLGDTWAWYYRFLCQHGTEEKRKELIAKCVLNDPRHGEVWQRVAKDPRNAGKKTEEVLELVAQQLGQAV
ncbi:pre-mRNA splicing factor prp1-like protein [Thermochaetoides thermophila DSM 1495]|uniref:Pre-mRNA splicing factor prp1-like protein n=1 Tax=Chaetomium thermophilum (strain DSM 1495 / CBS 144.50 / IMI 039719) TaxID=759272 RepID=G0SDA3_CHATD|nr:pre-mRNA splicing factor prp1-like protein [Thermochaetoides thermophila DSM 1495]EGS18504.1 pre-mRNA splicing factor prp1-like protein [Thermochaetoides thermophila DSM 1495]